ncbi:hypothetical protein JXA12_05765 [Candidatus Woesearchaeota archaeon]|nr:hypothetical protein [Candidatus Woesearchaeota archaeon]
MKTANKRTKYPKDIQEQIILFMANPHPNPKTDEEKKTQKITSTTLNENQLFARATDFKRNYDGGKTDDGQDDGDVFAGKPKYIQWTAKHVRAQRYYDSYMMTGPFIKDGLHQKYKKTHCANALKQLAKKGLIERIDIQSKGKNPSTMDVWRLGPLPKVSKFMLEKAHYFEEFVKTDFFNDEMYWTADTGLETKAPTFFKRFAGRETEYSPEEHELRRISQKLNKKFIVEITSDDNLNLDNYFNTMESLGIDLRESLSALPALYRTFNAKGTASKKK